MDILPTTFIRVTHSIDDGTCRTTGHTRYLEVGQVVKAQTRLDALAALNRGLGQRIGFERIGTRYRVLVGDPKALLHVDQLIFIRDH
jgi:hypothetical protein